MSDRCVKRLGWAFLFGLLLFRLWFSAVLPMSGDEAYFVLWGEHPSGGYYDHPPMIGWWLSGLLAVSHAEWVLRLPSTLLPLLLAAGGWWLVRPHGEARARWAAVLILLQPVNVWNVLITTDTPVILFSWLSILAYVAALRCAGRDASLAWHGASGALLSLAFLGKYFAALLGVAYLVHVVFVRRDALRWAGFFLLFAASLPGPIYNLWWNSDHCWVNLLFNFVNRQEDAGFSWNKPLLYAISILYLATPWLMWALFRDRAVLVRVIRGSVEAKLALCAALVPLAMFALISLGKVVGLHWLLSFIPLLAVLAALSLDENALGRLACWSGGLALLHVVAFSVAVCLPHSVWQNTRIGDGMALRAQIDKVKAQLAPFSSDYLLAMESYSSGSYLAYQLQRHVAVFGRGSFYARQDDFLTDWAKQDKGNILVFSVSPPKEADFRPYFDRIELRRFDVDGQSYHLVFGQGFNYPAYRDQILAGIRDRFYHCPSWLPRCECDFVERYFPENR